jgi:acetyltransferase-like isoleucine patch superfamily enzyme
VLDHHFKYATGDAIIEWDSPYVREIKLLNELAFEKYQRGEWCARDLFSLRSDAARLESLHVGDNLIGEYFSRVSVGEKVTIGRGANMVAHGGIRIGNGVKIGNNVQFLTVFHSLHPEQRLPIRTSPIIIEDGAQISDGALIVSSRKDGRPLVIGRGVHVLPNAIVLNDAHEGFVGGRPAVRMDMSEKMLQVFGHAAQPTPVIEPFDSVASARQRLGAQAQPVLPVYCEGKGKITSDGFYLLNCGSRLSLDGDLHVGKDVLIAHSVSITVEEGGKLEIGDRVWCGAGVNIHVGKDERVTIGKGSMLAAGANVTKNVPPGSVIVGDDVVKKTITEKDFDESMPVRWMTAANCIPAPEAIRMQKASLMPMAAHPVVMRDRLNQIRADQESYLGVCMPSDKAASLKFGDPF